MASATDVSQLQIEKKQLKEKIADMERQQKELGEILKRKNLKKTKTFGPQAVDPCNSETADGSLLCEYRAPRLAKTASSIKLPPAQKDLLKAIPFSKASKVTEFRIQTIKKQIDNEIIAASTAFDIFDNRKRAKDASKLPATIGKVSASLFPNRYKRGELPCSMEHGTTGNVMN